MSKASHVEGFIPCAKHTGYTSYHEYVITIQEMAIKIVFCRNYAKVRLFKLRQIRLTKILSI